MKKPKLSQALANYTKKQSEKTKEKTRIEAIELQKKNKAAKAQGGSSSSSNSKAIEGSSVALIKNDHVPCHVWTDSENRMQQRTRLPFHPKTNSFILLIGEGDFSYCRSLVVAFEAAPCADESTKDGKKKWKIVATCLDSRETVLRKYRKAQENLTFLEEREDDGSIEILFGVDGTKLHENADLKRIFNSTTVGPTRIIFNFPHTGAGIKDRQRNILAQQKMLQGFFDSVVKFVKMRKNIAIGSSGCTYTTTMIKKNRTINETEISPLKRKAPAVDLKKKRKKNKNKDLDDDEDSEDENQEFDSDSEEQSRLKVTNPEFLAHNAKIQHEKLGSMDQDGLLSEFDSKEEGERFEVHCTFKTGDPYDSWKPKALAQRTGHLTCHQSFKFVPELYPGYQHCRTIGDGLDSSNGVIEIEGWKEFLAGKPAKTFIFTYKE